MLAEGRSDFWSRTKKADYDVVDIFQQRTKFDELARVLHLKTTRTSLLNVTAFEDSTRQVVGPASYRHTPLFFGDIHAAAALHSVCEQLSFLLSHSTYSLRSTKPSSSDCPLASLHLPLGLGLLVKDTSYDHQNRCVGLRQLKGRV